VWRDATAIDAFAIGFDLKQKRSDVKGTMPRSEHGTVWARTDTLDSYAVFEDHDNDGELNEESEVSSQDVSGMLPMDNEL